MMNLPTIEERLDNPNLSKVEKSQREAFCGIVRHLNIGKDGSSLSVSCGDGTWDYLLFKNNKHVKEIVATDIVPCPVSSDDRELLQNLGKWDFVKVDESGSLPFEDEKFEFVFHLDVIEHTESPYFFLKEQHRVLKKGGTILVGTPNLLRPANIGKLLIGKLHFPVKIGYMEEIGEYIHILEFHEQQLRLTLQEIGFHDIEVIHCYFGLPFLNISFSLFPKRDIGKLMCHFLTAHAKK